jgi:hypothetical protein
MWYAGKFSNWLLKMRIVAAVLDNMYKILEFDDDAKYKALKKNLRYLNPIRM